MKKKLDVRKLILYHYRRAGFDPDEREFKVVLEKDGKRVMVGEYCNIEGTGHKPRDIYKLMDEGWRVVGIYSCFRWTWIARRYTGGYGYSDGEDYYGRPYREITYAGYYEKCDVFEGETRKRFQRKYWICLDTDEYRVMFGYIPKEIEKMFEETPWLEVSEG